MDLYPRSNQSQIRRNAIDALSIVGAVVHNPNPSIIAAAAPTLARLAQISKHSRANLGNLEEGATQAAATRHTATQAAATLAQIATYATHARQSQIEIAHAAALLATHAPNKQSAQAAQAIAKRARAAADLTWQFAMQSAQAAQAIPMPTLYDDISIANPILALAGIGPIVADLEERARAAVADLEEDRANLEKISLQVGALSSNPAGALSYLCAAPIAPSFVLTTAARLRADIDLANAANLADLEAIANHSRDIFHRSTTAAIVGLLEEIEQSAQRANSILRIARRALNNLERAAADLAQLDAAAAQEYNARRAYLQQEQRSIWLSLQVVSSSNRTTYAAARLTNILGPILTFYPTPTLRDHAARSQRAQRAANDAASRATLYLDSALLALGRAFDNYMLEERAA